MSYTTHYTVKTYDTDAHKRMTTPALLRVLNEAAMQHVLALKLSVWDLEPHRISWVLLRLEMNIYRLPELNEEIHLNTNPSGFERVFTYRDFRVTDGDGKCIVEATTTWVLFNLDNRRPTRIPNWIVERAPVATLPPLPRPAAKLRSWEGTNTPVISTPVSWHDLDFNWHLNNQHYLRLLLDSLPVEVLKIQRPRNIQLHYQMEAALGDQLASASHALGENEYQHRLCRADQTLAVGESSWVD